MSKNTLPNWEDVLSSAAALQNIIPEAILVGGTAAAVYAQHRVSIDADHVIPNLREHFDEILAQLESVAGWVTARVNRPVQILGNLDGIDTGIRQLIRHEPLEVTEVTINGSITIRIPSSSEMLRIKAALILKRNATRDYLDFVALADFLTAKSSVAALLTMDQLYPQPNGESALQQLQIQLANPMPFDLEKTDLTEYKNLKPKWHNWESVQAACSSMAIMIFDPRP